MTPLAHQIARDIAEKNRRMDDEQADLCRRFYDLHCFDVTEVVPIANDMAWAVCEGKTAFDCLDTFLPAERTWVEWRDEEMGRQAIFCEEVRNQIRLTHVYEFDLEYSRSRGLRGPWEDTDCSWASFDYGTLPRLQAVPLVPVAHTFEIGSVKYEPGETLDPRETALLDDHDRSMAAILLALINTPRIVGRRQHMPHRGLQRRLLKSRKNIGKFPLHAWTEVKLSISPPVDASGDEPVEAHLTGSKALHFCRAHLRIRLGRVEVVRGHWRGDASLGIKRSRYRVTA